MTPVPQIQTQFVHLTLTPVSHGDVTAFAALRLEDGVIRLFFNQAAHVAAFDLDANTDDDTARILQVVSIRGKSGLFVDVMQPHPAPTVCIRYNDVDFQLPVSDCEDAHLAGLDCLLTTANQSLSLSASPDQASHNLLANPRLVRDWLTHHMKGQGVTGAVFLNRLGPDHAGQDYVDKLAQHFAKKPLKALKRVVVLDVPGPTGRLGAGDERHLHNAPEAPNKNRMPVAPADPWRAPLGDEILLEYMRRALCGKAQGVAYLDVSDWLTPAEKGQETVFEKARAAVPDPVLQMLGRRAYPWNVSRKNKPVPGDHICTPFDFDGTFKRWVVCPTIVQHDNFQWRPHRIIGLTGNPAPQDQLWRFMALRHPDATAAQLAPKSSLREDTTLLALSQVHFGHQPSRMPQAEAKATKPLPATQRGGKIVLVTAMKNEGPFLLEWIAHHRAIGVSDIIVYTNDCTDGTDTLLDTLAARGIVEHYPNPYRAMDLRPQHAAFRAAEDLPAVKNADWLMTMDVDEFINIHIGQGHLNDLFAAIGDANMISCTWRLFGNGGIRAFKDQPVTAQFTQCAVKEAGRPHQAWGFKTLYQNNGHFKKLGVHRPKGLRGQLVDQLHWVNGSGRPLPVTEYRTGWRSNARTIGYDLVTLNHYAVRSVDSFLVKRDRGRVNHVDRDQGAAYWFRMNHNTTQDHSIQRMQPAMDAELSTLMADPDIAAGHMHCVAQHQSKIDALLADPAQRAFHDMLCSDRFQSLSKMLPFFGAHVFLAGPDCVPQTLVDQFNEGALSADHYFTVRRPETTEH